MGQISIGACKCGGYGQVFNKMAEKETGVCHRDIGNGFFGHLVTAKIKGKEDTRQGVVINLTPLIIRGKSSTYECEGNPTKVGIL